jgi:hypothetical protein
VSSPAIPRSTAKRGRSYTGRVFAILGVIAISVYLAELVCVKLRYASAARLIDSVRALKMGVTTADEVRQLSERFGGTLYPARLSSAGSLFDQSAPTYSLEVTSPLISFRNHHFNGAGPGIRFWVVSAALSIKDGHLSEYSLGVLVKRSDDFDLRSYLSVADEIPIDPRGSSYLVNEAHVTGPPGEALLVRITPRASVAERRKAFDFDLRCLTAMRECRHVCQLSPSAWVDVGDHRQYYEDGREKVTEAECENFLPQSRPASAKEASNPISTK